MAFRSFTGGSSTDAGTVVLRADTGQFNAEIEQAERQWRDSVGSMSREALKLELAQKRLATSLDKYGAESDQAKRATINLKNAEEQATVAANKTTAAVAREERTLGRLGRGALAGSGAMRGLGRSVAFASGSFLGGAGLVYALKSTIDAGREAQAVEGRLAVAVKNSGLSYGQYRKQIHDTIEAQSNLSAFDDEDLKNSFARLIVRTHNVSEALRLNAVAADVARGRHIDLEAASGLVTKASLGMAGQLRRLGIDVNKNAKAQELLNKLTETYSGQAARFGREGAGAQERLSVAIKNTQENLAQGLLPAVTDVSNEIADWLGKSKNQERLQKDVNDAIHAGTGFVQGLAGALRTVKAAADPVVSALGGIEQTLKIAGGIWVAWKVKALLGFTATARASAVTSEKMIVEAQAAGRAWDIATRPRTMMVTTTTTGPGGGTGGTGGYGGGGYAPTQRPTARGRTVAERINQYGRPPTAPSLRPIGGGMLGGLILGSLAFAQSGEQSNARIAYDPKNGKWYSVLADGSRHETSEALVRRYDPDLWARVMSDTGGHPDEGTRGPSRTPVRTAPARRAGGRRGGGLSRFQTLTLAADRADLSGNLQKQLTAQKALEAYYAQIASNKKLHGDKLYEAQQNLIAQEQRVKGIEDQIAANEQQAHDAAVAKREKNTAKLVAARKKETAARQKRAADIAREEKAADLALPGTGPYATSRRGFAPGGISPIQAAKMKAKADAADKPLTAADVHRMQADFLSSLQGITNQFGSNITPDAHAGQTAINTWQTAKLTEKLVGSVDQLTRGVQHPGAKYARIEMMEPFGSTGSV